MKYIKETSFNPLLSLSSFLGKTNAEIYIAFQSSSEFKNI